LPGRNFVAQALCLAQHALRRALIGPEVGAARLLVERVEALLLLL
jgi:hypothetical protein